MIKGIDFHNDFYVLKYCAIENIINQPFFMKYVDHKELPHAITLSSVLNEKDIAEKVRLATEHLHMPFCQSLLMNRARMSKENATTLADYIIVMKSFSLSSRDL